MRELLCLVLLLALSAPASADSPILRYTSYVIVEVAGKPVPVRFESRPYGTLHDDFTYKDQPAYAVIGADGHLLDERDGRLGLDSTVTVPGAAGEFGLIEARSGNNYCIAYPEVPYAFVATETAPLNVVRGFERLHFFVPKGLTAASVFFHAWSVGEAGRAIIYDPQGNVAAELEDDFNQPTAVSFVVPEGQDDRAWAVALLPPQRDGWEIDDCKVWLSDSLPGLLVPQAQWAERLSRPFVVAWRPLLDFEGESPLKYAQWSRPPEEGAALPAFDVALSDEQPHTGKQSLRVEMKLPEKTPRYNELKIFTSFVEVGSLERVKLWLYGDGSGRSMTVRVRDQNMEHHYCSVGEIDWKGWGEVTADFTKGGITIGGGDENKRIDGPEVSIVIHIRHEQGQPTRSVYYVDDVAVSP
jgi:hypothetical protein